MELIIIVNIALLVFKHCEIESQFSIEPFFFFFYRSLHRVTVLDRQFVNFLCSNATNHFQLLIPHFGELPENCYANNDSIDAIFGEKKNRTICMTKESCMKHQTSNMHQQLKINDNRKLFAFIAFFPSYFVLAKFASLSSSVASKDDDKIINI